MPSHLCDRRNVTYVILNRKTPEERLPPFPEEVKHCYSNIRNPRMCSGFPETPERIFEISKWDMHLHLLLQEIFCYKQVPPFHRQVSSLRGTHRNLRTSTCLAVAKRPLQRDRFREVLGLSSQLSRQDCSSSCVRHRGKARADYFLALLHPASWENIMYENPVMGLDWLKHRMHCMFQVDAKAEYHDPDAGLILLHIL